MYWMILVFVVLFYLNGNIFGKYKSYINITLKELITAIDALVHLKSG